MDMKRVFKTRHFSRWMRKTELTDQALCLAVADDELAALQELAKELLTRSFAELDTAVTDGTLMEICNGP